MTQKPKWSERMRNVARSMKREMRVYRLVLKDPRTPLPAKVLLGLAVAVVISFVTFRGYALAHFPAWEVVRSALITLVVGCAISITAGIAPAYMAARKQPVDAMRIEE